MVNDCAVRTPEAGVAMRWRAARDHALHRGFRLAQRMTSGRAIRRVTFGTVRVVSIGYTKACTPTQSFVSREIVMTVARADANGAGSGSSAVRAGTTGDRSNTGPDQVGAANI